MFRLNTLWLQLATALLLALFIAGCSSSEDDGGATGGAAAASSGGGDEATEGYKLTQAFDMSIEVTSPVFSRIRRIPKKYSCPGRRPKAGTAYYDPALAKYGEKENSSPPLDWTGVPEGTKSIALLLDSDQAPGERWVHWLVWNLPPDTTSLAERMARPPKLPPWAPPPGRV